MRVLKYIDRKAPSTVAPTIVYRLLVISVIVVQSLFLISTSDSWRIMTMEEERRILLVKGLCHLIHISMTISSEGCGSLERSVTRCSITKKALILSWSSKWVYAYTFLGCEAVLTSPQDELPHWCSRHLGFHTLHA